MAAAVVVTGLGVVSPIGVTTDEFWDGCVSGRSGARRLDTPWVTETGLATRIAAPVVGFDPETANIPSRQIKLLDRTTQFALAAAHESLLDANFGLREDDERKDALHVEGADASRIATSIGSGIGGIATLESTHAIWVVERSKARIKRYALPMLIPNAPAGQVAIRFGARAECKAINTACAAGTMALGDAWRMLVADEADVALAGGTEGVAGDDDAYSLMGFDRLRTMSTRNDEPQRASRPFDRERDGFVLGEGAAVLVLEREEHARARGARIYARIAGYASNCDAHSMMQPDESGATIVRLIESALRSSGFSAGDVDYISAHGTSTLVNDRTESRALRALFGSRCDHLPVTALKSMTGHAIGASGPLEVAAAVLSIDRGLLAPTINYETPDPECDLDVVANRPRERRVDVCLKLSYGFGGHNACLVISRP